MSVQYVRAGCFDEYVFSVKHDRDGWYWEFEHDAMWAQCDGPGVKAAVVEGLDVVIRRLRRWADELEKEKEAMETTRPTESDS